MKSFLCALGTLMLGFGVVKLIIAAVAAKR